jgi:cytosolic carboxypeptidase protein 2/3
VLTARVHPGETNSSYIMQGVIEYLCGNERPAKLLRNTYVFKVVPMINPDGVIVGNYRCSLAGLDLNRQYIMPNQKITPEIWAVKDVSNFTRLVVV